MIFVALLLTLRSSEKGCSEVQPALALLGRELVIHALPGYEALEEPHPTHGNYALAHVMCRQGQKILRLTLWGPSASSDATAIISHYAHHPSLLVSSHYYTIVSDQVSPPGSAALATWADLMTPQADRLIRLRFLSPTAFQQRSVSEPCGLDFPEPGTVFSQLLQRWTDLGGPPLTCALHSFLERDGCVVSEYRLQTKRFLLSGEMGSGWVGWIVYRCRTDHPESIAAINSLARLACFIGTGVATQQGMGFTRLVCPGKRR